MRMGGRKRKVRGVEVVDLEQEEQSRFQLATQPANCCLCGQASTKDMLESGQLYYCHEITIHYFCLLFSTQVEQKGRDTEGLYGFLEEDIKSAVASGQHLTCTFCSTKGATVSCKVKTCCKRFHFPCGYSAGCLFLFLGRYTAYCDVHWNRSLPSVLPLPPPQTVCAICFEELGSEEDARSLFSAPCCRGYLHTACTQRMALTSGKLSFRCPICNNREKFIERSLQHGLYIPHKDPEWEADEEFYNYRSQADGERQCSLTPCFCLAGRQADKRGSHWELVTCDLCGATSAHIQCAKLDTLQPDYTCQECLVITTRVAAQHSPSPDLSRHRVKPCSVRLKRLSRTHQVAEVSHCQRTEDYEEEDSEVECLQLTDEEGDSGEDIIHVVEEDSTGTRRKRKRARKGCCGCTAGVRRKKHASARPHRCHICNKTFRYNSALGRHMVSAHKLKSRGHQKRKRRQPEGDPRSDTDDEVQILDFSPYEEVQEVEILQPANVNQSNHGSPVTDLQVTSRLSPVQFDCDAKILTNSVHHFFPCPLCWEHYMSKQALVDHLVATHFLERLKTAVPSQPPYFCPQPECTFAATERQLGAAHLGRRHESVLLELVREVVPRFTFTGQAVSSTSSSSSIIDSVEIGCSSDEDLNVADMNDENIEIVVID